MSVTVGKMSAHALLRRITSKCRVSLMKVIELDKAFGSSVSKLYFNDLRDFINTLNRNNNKKGGHRFFQRRF